MNPNQSMDRRTFLKNSALAGAGLALAGNRAPAAVSGRDANSKIRLACIGVGTQGHRLLQAAQRVPGTEIAVICDLYTGNINRAKGLCTNKDVRIVKEWESVVADPTIDDDNPREDADV